MKFFVLIRENLHFGDHAKTPVPMDHVCRFIPVSVSKDKKTLLPPDKPDGSPGDANIDNDTGTRWIVKEAQTI